MAMTSARLLLALFCLSGCQSETIARTEVLLVVDSDLAVPAQLDRIEVHVDGPSGPTQDSIADLGEGPNSLPRSVALVHEGGALGPLHATVLGLHEGQVVLTREARLSFVAGQTLVLPMHLVAGCVGVACGDQSCGELGCGSIDIDPSSLAPYAGSEPRLSIDGGVSAPGDAGVAVPVDGAAMPDAASRPDAGREDSGLVPNDGGGGDAGAKVDAGGRPDAGACLPTMEMCNSRDDDCDGRIDNGFDLSSDPNNCGVCGMRCLGVTRRCCAGSCRTGC